MKTTVEVMFSTDSELKNIDMATVASPACHQYPSLSWTSSSSPLGSCLRPLSLVDYLSLFLSAIRWCQLRASSVRKKNLWCSRVGCVYVSVRGAGYSLSTWQCVAALLSFKTTPAFSPHVTCVVLCTHSNCVTMSVGLPGIWNTHSNI